MDTVNHMLVIQQQLNSKPSEREDTKTPADKRIPIRLVPKRGSKVAPNLRCGNPR